MCIVAVNLKQRQLMHVGRDDLQGRAYGYRHKCGAGMWLRMEIGICRTWSSMPTQAAGTPLVGRAITKSCPFPCRIESSPLYYILCVMVSRMVAPTILPCKCILTQHTPTILPSRCILNIFSY